MKSETYTCVLTQQNGTASVQEHQNALYLLLQEFDRVCKALEIPYFLFAGTLLGAVRHHGFIPWDDDLDVLLLREDYERFLSEAPALLGTEQFFLQKEFSEHWPMFFSKLRLNGTTCLEKYHPKDPAAHQGVYLDIFPCDTAYSSAFARKLQFACSKVVVAKGLEKRGYSTESRMKKLFMTACRLLPNGFFLRFVKGPKKKTAFVHSFLGGASKYQRSVYPAECFEQSVCLTFESGTFPVPEQYDTLLRILYDDYMRIPEEEERSIKQHALLVDLTRSYECYDGWRDNMEFTAPTRSIR